MASTSRSKKATVSNPINLSVLLKDDTQRKRFLHRYLERPILAPKYGYLSAFENAGCSFTGLIRDQALHVFVEDKSNFYPELIRAFYCNLEIKDGVLTSWVKGKSIVMTLSEFALCLNLPSTGVELGPLLECPWEDFVKKDYYLSLCRFSEAEITRKRQRTSSSSKRDSFGAGNLTVENRLLHYFLVYSIYPRSFNHATATEFDLEMMYAFMHKESVNWAFIVMMHMAEQKTLTGSLPYAFAITRILNHFRVDLSNEFKVEITIKDNRLDLTSLGRMQIKVCDDGVLRWHDEVVEVDDEPVAQPAAAQDVGDVPPGMQMFLDELRGLRQEVNTGFASVHSRIVTGMDTLNNRLDQLVLTQDQLVQDVQGLAVQLDLMDSPDAGDGA